MTDKFIHLAKPWRWDGAVLAIVIVGISVFVFVPEYFVDTMVFTSSAILQTLPFIIFAVFAVAFVKATGAETLMARAFEGSDLRMIGLAALLGGLSPFCSCEVIPFIAALLAVGAPLGAVMAFWLASPLMDPAMFSITSGTLGFEFAIAKAVAAVGLGMFGGFVTKGLATSVVFADPLRERPQVGGCCGVKKPFQGAPVWAFWTEKMRRDTFWETGLENFGFLMKWLVLAYLIESLMIRFIPAEMIAAYLGGDGVWPIVFGAFVGAPAYLNGYAAVPLVDALLNQGMAPGAAMSFMIAGGVSCIPAAIAVWALVKPRVFVAYLGLAVTGSIIAGILWQAVA